MWEGSAHDQQRGLDDRWMSIGGTRKHEMRLQRRMGEPRTWSILDSSSLVILGGSMVRSEVAAQVWLFLTYSLSNGPLLNKF